MNALGSNTYTSATAIVLDDRLINAQNSAAGGWLKLWLKSSGRMASDGSPVLNAIIDGNITIPMEKVAQTGEWSLYQIKIQNWGTKVVGDRISIGISYNKGAAEQVYVDDLRFQPLQSQVVAYVYDVKKLRELARFDDQHFGLYSQYNAEGKLVRKLIETERGLMTVQETQYNTPAVKR